MVAIALAGVAFYALWRWELKASYLFRVGKREANDQLAIGAEQLAMTSDQ